ncbi:RICIN domain-containing protein [Plantactinospora veratri]
MNRRTWSRTLLPLMATAVALTAAPTIGQAAPHSANSAGYYRVVNRLSGKCLAPQDSADGLNVTQRTCDGSASQRWLLDTASVGTIVNQQTDKCLELADDSSANGQPIVTWTCDGYSGQRWMPLHKSGQYFELHPYSTGKCLDLANDNTADGAYIQQWGCNWLNNFNQQWQLI